MQTNKCIKEKFKFLFALLMAVVIQFLICSNIFADEPGSGGTGTSPTQEISTEHFEMVAKNGTNEKQIIFELWGHDIDFNGFIVRFSWDTSKYSTSNISTNAITTDASEYFTFNADNSYDPTISSLLDYQSLAYDIGGTGIRAMVTFNPPVNIGGLVIDSGDGKVLSTSGGVLIGTYSFKIIDGDFDISDFSIATNEGGSLPTGVKIDLGLTNKYYESDRFIFVDETASKDATLKSLLIDNVDDNTRKYLDVNNNIIDIPLEKNVTLMEYIDKVNLTAVRNEENATMKIKFPVKDQDGTVTYSEEELTDGTPIELNINKLGEEDTVFTITVTAQDGKTQNEYTVTIKRPFATLKGSLEAVGTKEADGITDILNNDADIYVYNQIKLKDDFDWDWDKKIANLEENDDMNMQLHLIPQDLKYDVDVTGVYTIFVIPGTYTVLVDKAGYLDLIYTDVTIVENQEIDFGKYTLQGGETNKDGIVDLGDNVAVTYLYGEDLNSERYRKDCDFNNDGSIDLSDYVRVSTNYGATREIISYK